MGHALYQSSSAARERFDQADAILGWSLTDVCFNGPEDKLTETRICQPALYVHGIAAVAAMEEQGELPDISAAAGLSLGELTAHAVAGTYDFATGLRLVAERGRLMQEACDATEGTMASLIGGSIEAAEELAGRHDVDIGNFNCPGQTVLSGRREGIAAAVAEAKEAGFKMAVPLKVAGAYHSRLMQGARDAFADVVAAVELSRPRIPVFSNASGQPVDEPEAIRQALVTQITSTVRWTDCFSGMIALGIGEFFECGPGGILAGLAKRIDRSVSIINKDG